MNQFVDAITLAIVQGLTEFLPISSSAHLILVPLFTGWPDQGLAFDIAVHIGTLLAVCAYFRKEIFFLIWGFFRFLKGKPSRFYSPLSIQLIIATIPIALAGFLFHDFIGTTLRSPLVIACSTIVFGVLLGASDYFRAKKRVQRKLGQIRWKDTLIIGLAQVLALIPGTSRSGITMTAGFSLGFNRVASAKFSFLLSIPVIMLAGTYESAKILRSDQPVDWLFLTVGISFAAISAYFCIHAFLRFIRKIGVLPFVIYRLCLGTFLLFIFL
jgi:undecaprenyl-diphosphatase